MNGYLAVAYDWGKRSNIWEPFLKVFDGERFTKIFFSKNSNISYEVSEKKYCIGYSENGEHTNCPGNREVKSGRRCPECRKLDNSLKCIICDGSRCLFDEEELRHRCKDVEMYVYLALFGKGLIKVGTASKRRVPKRWINQGADFATCFVKVMGALKARQIEKKIYTGLDFVSKVNVKRKIEILGMELNKNESVMKIKDSITKIENEYPSLSTYIVDKDVRDIGKIYDLNMQPNPLPISGDIVRGNIIGSKGQLLFLKNSGSEYYFNLKKMIGRKIKHTERSMELQSSLDGF